MIHSRCPVREHARAVAEHPILRTGPQRPPSTSIATWASRESRARWSRRRVRDRGGEGPIYRCGAFLANKKRNARLAFALHLRGTCPEHGTTGWL